MVTRKLQRCLTFMTGHQYQWSLIPLKYAGSCEVDQKAFLPLPSFLPALSPLYFYLISLFCSSWPRTMLCSTVSFWLDFLLVNLYLTWGLAEHLRKLTEYPESPLGSITYADFQVLSEILGRQYDLMFIFPTGDDRLPGDCQWPREPLGSHQAPR